MLSTVGVAGRARALRLVSSPSPHSHSFRNRAVIASIANQKYYHRVAGCRDRVAKRKWRRVARPLSRRRSATSARADIAPGSRLTTSRSRSDQQFSPSVTCAQVACFRLADDIFSQSGRTWVPFDVVRPPP